MLRSRFFWFLVMILLGVAAGLYYGWSVKPLRSASVPAHMLRQDYKTDYILMVAEIYKVEQDASLAAVRLKLLEDRAALRMVQEAILYAGEQGYSAGDVDLMVKLSQGLSKLPGGGGL